MGLERRGVLRDVESYEAFGLMRHVVLRGMVLRGLEEEMNVCLGRRWQGGGGCGSGCGGGGVGSSVDVSQSHPLVSNSVLPSVLLFPLVLCI
jgi:hypothetical protein